MADDDLERRVILLEASQTVTDARVNELEAWRRRDEPLTLQLVQDATVADQVRAALREKRGRDWTLAQKIIGGIIGVPAVAAAWIGLVAELHHIFP